MAKELGYFEKYGLNVDVVKQASWASTRDNLLTGEIEGAHCLFGMPFSSYTGVGGQAGKELHDRHDAEQQRPGDHALEGRLRRQGRLRRPQGARRP